MEKVRIGRAFTPFQHHKLVQNLEKFIEPETEILVLPNIAYLYISGQIKEWEAEELFNETWNKIEKIQAIHNLKILVSTPETTSNLKSMVKDSSDLEIRVERTQEGIKYESEDFSQTNYSKAGSRQTTFSFWNEKTGGKHEIKAKTA